MYSQLKVRGRNQWRSKPGCLRLHISVMARPLKHQEQWLVQCHIYVGWKSCILGKHNSVIYGTPYTTSYMNRTDNESDAGSQQYDVVAAPSHPSFSSSFYSCSSNYGRSWAGRLHRAPRGALHRSPPALASSSSCCLCPSA
jgi:hypothetical protein